MDEADRIWNRSLDVAVVPKLPGDIALAAVLGFHSLAMSGGVLDAVERGTAEELAAAEAGFRWLGLEPAARLIADLRSDVDAGALDDDEQADLLEVSADGRYDAIIPGDAALEPVFRERLAEMPDAFSP